MQKSAGKVGCTSGKHTRALRAAARILNLESSFARKSSDSLQAELRAKESSEKSLKLVCAYKGCHPGRLRSMMLERKERIVNYATKIHVCARRKFICVFLDR